MNKKNLHIRIPGYVFSATIHIPEFSAYAIWYSAYLKNIIEENNDINLSKLPWPENNDFIKRTILTNLIQEGLLKWDNDKFIIPDEIKSNLFSVEAIKNFFFKEKKYTGKWWIDAIEGNVLPFKIFNKYEVDLSETKNNHKEIITVNDSDISLFYEVETFIDADISDLMQTVFRGESYNEIDKAYIKGGLIVDKELKEIEIPIKSNRLIPPDLARLEPLLISKFPHIFNLKNKITQKKINWKLSPVEVFYDSLKHIIISNDVSKEQVKKLNDLLENKNLWLDWLNNGETVIPVSGHSTTIQFTALEDICSNLENNDKLIILSSFFNAKNIKGFSNTIKKADKNAEIFILYGHPEDDDVEIIEKNIKKYKDALKKELPDSKIKIIATQKRTHEKIVISSKGDWMLGSWNATSSPIDTIRFEASVQGESINFSIKLLNRIKELLEESLYNKFNEKLIRKKIKKKTDETVFNKLKDAISILYENFEKNNFLENINNILKLLHPFIVKSKLTIINEHQTRDLLIRQIHSAKEQVVLATDSLKESGFDNTLISELTRGIYGQKKLYLLWGKNYRLTKEDEAALYAIDNAKSKLNDYLITDIKPMENHSKFAIIDSKRIFITSENLLNYGGEKNKYEGRETGLLIENIPISETIQGAVFLHKCDIFSNKSNDLYDLLFLGNESYKALKELSDDSIDFSDISIIKSSIDLEIKDYYKPLKNKFKQNHTDLHKIALYSYLINPLVDNKWIPFYEKVDVKKNIIISQNNFPNNDKKESENIKKAIDIINDNLVKIPAGQFKMGFNGVKDEKPEHIVVITNSFYASKYLITQKIWELVMGTLPANITKFQRHPQNPIFHISFNDVQEFLKILNKYTEDGFYDLPTEAEWEYMCRAGSNSKYTCGNKVPKLDEYAWSKRNAEGKIMNVGLKKENKFGLYDIHGLMFEMCKDNKRKYSEKKVKDPIGSLNTENIVTPGGAWGNTPGLRPPYKDYFRCSARNISKKTDSSYRLSFRIIKR